ncbi:MAG: class I SAM-dependent methyltransferase [Victivallaceae bacterium]
MKIDNILKNSLTYDFFQNLVGEKRYLKILTEEYVKVEPGQRLLDIGCGTAGILRYLPEETDYCGLDIHEKYIDSARQRYRNQGEFYCIDFDDADNLEIGKFDVVTAIGIIHHLNDIEFERLLEMVVRNMNAGARFISIDGCRMSDNSWFERLMLNHDRGKYVRNTSSYRTVAEKIFNNVKVNVRRDLLYIPYSHVVMELSDIRQGGI